MGWTHAEAEFFSVHGQSNILMVKAACAMFLNLIGREGRRRNTKAKDEEEDGSKDGGHNTCYSTVILNLNENCLFGNCSSDKLVSLIM